MLGFGEMVKQRERRLLCEICQTKFVCEGNNQNNCWCMKVENKTIDLNLKDCICRLCLSKLAKYTQKYGLLGGQKEKGQSIEN